MKQANSMLWNQTENNACLELATEQAEEEVIYNFLQS